MFLNVDYQLCASVLVEGDAKFNNLSLTLDKLLNFASNS